MAITQNTYTGDGSTVLFSFTFPYLETTDIKVSVNGAITTAYTFANATTVQFNTAPANGDAIRIYRETDDSALTATFYPGSAIRSQDLNSNFTQSLYVAQEVNSYTLKDTGNVTLFANYSFVGTTSFSNTASFLSGVSFTQSPTGPTPVNGNHLATKAYVDTFVKDTGSLTLSANYQFTNPILVGTPTVSGHAATKAYVDGFATNQGNVTSGSKGDIEVSLDLTTWSLTAGSVTTAKVADDAITTAKVTDDAITTAKLAASSVTTAKVADSAITPAKLDRQYTRPSFVFFTSSF